MSFDWKKSVNQSVGFICISDIDNYISVKPTTPLSPIDNYYSSTKSLLGLTNPTILNQDPVLGSLILVGFVSSTENYFRELFSKIIQICPLAKSHASKQSISLGSVLWHGSDIVGITAFENLSLASKEQIIKTSKKYVHYEITERSDSYNILEEYEKICQLRHCIVHSNSNLGGKNALQLEMSPSLDNKIVQIDYAAIQECALICSTLVISFNQELFQEMARRWAIEWVNQSDWNAKKELKSFKSLWSTFYSTIDSDNHLIENPTTMIKCKNQIKIYYS